MDETIREVRRAHCDDRLRPRAATGRLSSRAKDRVSPRQSVWSIVNPVTSKDVGVAAAQMSFYRRRLVVIKHLGSSAVLLVVAGWLAAMRYLPTLQLSPVAPVMVRLGITDVVGWCGLLFFGMCAAVYVSFLFSPTPALTIGADGMVDRTHAGSPGFVAWNDIADVDTFQLGGSTCWVAVRLRNPDVLLRKAPGVIAAFARAVLPLRRLTTSGRSMRHDTAYLWTGALDIEPERLVKLLRTRCRASTGRSIRPIEGVSPTR
jgi:hypothetical protein